MVNFKSLRLFGVPKVEGPGAGSQSRKSSTFSLLRKSVLIREQDAELAGATDRPIVIQKSEEFPKLFHLFNLSTVVNLMPKPKTEDL